MPNHICSACDKPFIPAESHRTASLPICGSCRTKMAKLCAMPIKTLSREENEALARSMVQMGNNLRRAMKHHKLEATHA